MPIPGILFVQTRIKDPSHFAESNYNKWYSEIHIHDFTKSGLSDLAIRYKNVNPEAKWPYLAIYRLPDIAMLQDPSVLGSIPQTHELIPDGKSWMEFLDVDARPMVLLQKFDGQVKKEGPRGKALRTVTIEPAEGGDGEFDEWYRKQHLDMLSMVAGYRRSTRYQLAPEATVLGHPRFLACHEYDDKDFPVDQVKLVTGTEWSKKIIGSAKTFVGDLWEEIAVAGAIGEKL